MKDLHIEITDACDLKCRICSHWRKRSAPMDAETFRRILSLPDFAEAREISLSGGEPFLHPLFPFFLSGALEKNRKGRIIILSNLFSGEKMLRVFSALPLSGRTRIHVGTSIDGTEKTHDELRGIRGSFRKVCESVREMKRVFPEISISATFTISEANASMMHETRLLVKEKLGIPLYFQSVFGNDETGLPFLGGRGRAEAAFQVKKMLLTDKKMSLRETEMLGRLHLLLSGKKRNIYCRPQDKFVMISAEGDFYLCPKNREIILGNVTEGYLPGKLGKRIPERASEKCENCDLLCSF